MGGDYIKVSRSLLDWEWYRDINTKVLFLHMLLKANWKDGRFEGTTVPRGSFVSSVRKLACETELTEREIRTAISHLKTTGEVTSKTTNKYSVFTVVNYDLYQSGDTQSDTQTTNERQPNDILTTTIEEKKEGKKDICTSEPVPSDMEEQLQKDFGIIYAKYPKKRGRSRAFEYYRGYVTTGRLVNRKRYRLTNRQIYQAIAAYVLEREEEGAELKYYQDFSTFMNKTILDYLGDDGE